MNIIREHRKAAGMTQEELAMMTGCRRETIANIEKDRYNPSLALADKIAQALECSIYELWPFLLSKDADNKRISTAMKWAYQDLADKASELASLML